MTRNEILESAIKCVTRERNKQHGEPEDNFEIISQLWSAYLQIPISKTDLSVLMILFKAGRIRTGSKHIDNWIDIAGYAACGGEMI